MKLQRLAVISVLFLTACPETGVVCRPGTGRCGTGCADFQSDSRNCGGCGQACLSGQACNAGVCECQTGTTPCNGQCVVTESDPLFCGGCNTKCTGTTPVCEAGMCRGDCSAGKLRCGFSCIDVVSDSMNCGACGNVCTDTRSCHAGVCTWDMIAACLSTGQVVGVESVTGNKGPLQPMGIGPLSLAQYGKLLLVADNYDKRLLQARLGTLEKLSEYNPTGAGPNQVIVDAPYVYTANSVGHTLQILAPVGDAGCPAAVQPDAGCSYVALGDGGSALPLGADGGCFHPQNLAADAGCVDAQLADGGLGPFVLEDAGCFNPPKPPAAPVEPCFQGGTDAGLKLATIGELDTGANTYPQAVVKANGALWVPLYGGFFANWMPGQKVLKVDISNPRMPRVAATVDLMRLDLKAFDGGVSIPRPYAIIESGGQLLVALNNLAEDYAPAGPGLIATIDPVTLDAGVIDLSAADCLNPVQAEVNQGHLFVSCAGKVKYHPPEYYVESIDHAGLLMANLNGSGGVMWNPQCPAGDDGGCLLILPSRFVVRDGRVYLGDQNGGRIFVADVRDGGFTELRGYAGASAPIQACGIDPLINASNVADIISIP